MTINNCGTLMVCWNDRVSESYAWKVATAALAEEGIDKGEYGVTFNRKECAIEFEDYPGSSLEDYLRNVQNAIGPNVWLEGNLEYYGDFDGWIDVTRDGAESGDKSSQDLHYADDRTLIDMLEKRGYTVTKAKKSSKKKVNK
jgi:hypothetical protein